MGRDKSRAHLHSLHRIDSNTEQQLEALRQKLAQVGTENKYVNVIKTDLFTDVVSKLNLLDLRSIMGCSGSTHSVFTHTFWAKRELRCIISREKGDHYYIQTRHNNLLSHYNLFLGKLEQKLARKACVNTE